MLKYEFKKIYSFKKTTTIIMLTIFFVVMMTRNLGNETNYSIEGALDFFIFTNNEYNMILLFIIMMISTPVFSMEETYNMSPVISVSQKGRKKIPIIKMVLVLFVTEIYVAIYGITNIIGYKNSFGHLGNLTKGLNEFVDKCM